MLLEVSQYFAVLTSDSAKDNDGPSVIVGVSCLMLSRRMVTRRNDLLNCS